MTPARWIILILVTLTAATAVAWDGAAFGWVLP